MLFDFLRGTSDDQVDVLGMKQKELELYTAQYNSAISIVTSTVDNLRMLGDRISSTIQEIEEYQDGLDKAKEGLRKMKERNDKVAANFSALLGE